MSTMLEAVGRAIKHAQSVRAFGLYDYTAYPGDAPPHVVLDEFKGKPVLATWNRDEAQKKYEECCRDYVAKHAINAMDQWRFEAAGITSDVGGSR
ncbi:hypothetical protein ABIA95_000222 [Bradyrhizobium sp. LA8.1]|uniref:hypothetical protein n=1 Tax=unclassified Bradyrhizobium TaxID=2631580 RepID=UPI0033924792